MKRRLVLSYLVVVLVVLVALEVPLGVLAANHDKASMASQAEREATALAVLVAEANESGHRAQVKSLAVQFRQRTGGEVVVVDASGKAMAASSADGDHDARRDEALIGKALRGQASSLFAFDEGQPVASAAVPLSLEVTSGQARVVRGAVYLDMPASAAEASAHTTWVLLAIFGAGVLALSTLLALGLARSVSRPLARLQHAVARLGQGDLGARADGDSGPPEVKSLAEQFNNMADQLSEVLEAQARFVSDASHQLRSPLTALRLRLENLEPDIEGQAAEGLAAAGQEVQRLSRIVDGLLALTRAGSEHPKPVPVAVGAVVADRCQAWSALADERQVSLSQGTVPAGDLTALLVPGDLEQILDNLLDNALDACPPGASIDVRVVPEGPGRVNVHVVDTGPGLSAEDRRRAFERFWQGPSDASAGSPGAGKPPGGLGLAIVRELASRNGAEVELLPAPRSGLDAVVRLELASPADRGPRPGPVPSRGRVLREHRASHG